jgi:O-antigen ligase
MPGHNTGQVSIGVVVFFFILSAFVPFIILGFPIHQSFIAFVAVILFVIAFSNTDIALIIVILSMLLSPELRAGQIASRNINIRAEDLFIFVIFFAWMAKMAVRKELGLMRRNPLNGPILIYITICVVSSLLALIGGSIKFKDSFFYLLKYFEYFLIFFMVSNNLRTMAQAKVFIFFLLLTCFIVCCIAWFQIPAGERVSAPFESEGGEPNTFAGYLLLMMAIIIGSFLHASNRKQKIWWLGFLGFAAVPFIMTLSREGWISFFPMFLAFIALYKRSRIPMIVILIAAIFVAPALMPKKVHERVKDTFAKERSYVVFGKKFDISESTAARIDSWGVAAKKLVSKPFLGYGVPGGGVIDNQYTRVLTETGLFGFFAFMWIIVLLFRQASAAYNLVPDPFARGITLGFICGLVGLLTQSFGAAVFILIRVMEPFWFIAAIVLSLPQVMEDECTELAVTAEGGKI